MRKRSLPNPAGKQSATKIPTKHNFFRTPLGIAIIGALLCLGAVLRVANLSNVSSRSPDELVYTLQAKILLEGRQPALRSLIAEYQRDPDIRLFPPPTRLGYLLPLAAAMRLTGRRDESVGAYLSCAASIGSLSFLL
jgi:hypothetical protein